MVRCTFSPARAWRPTAGARLARTLGSTQRQAVRHPSRVSACRRELNNHDAAEPRDYRLPAVRPPQQMVSEQSRIGASLCQVTHHGVQSRRGRWESQAGRLGAAVPHRTSGLRGKHWTSISSSGRRGQQGQVFPRPVVRRLKYAASYGQQRGAGSFCAGPHEIAGPWQAHRLWPFRAALPNPSLKRSPNGGPPGPGRWYGVHFHQPGPGVPPLVPS